LVSKPVRERSVWVSISIEVLLLNGCESSFAGAAVGHARRQVEFGSMGLSLNQNSAD
jgi:hypothetical protein